MFNPEDIEHVDIYPPISIARVGDSSEYFLGTGVPGRELPPNHVFRDSNGKIKKQAALFRVYAFDKHRRPLGEITSENYTMNWTVHVANKKGCWVKFHGKYDQPKDVVLRNQKADEKVPNDWSIVDEYTEKRSSYIIDAQKQNITGKTGEPVPLMGTFEGSQKTLEVQLGELRTDQQGHLIFLPSDGASHPVGKVSDVKGFDNDDWVDTMCDGWVEVEVSRDSYPTRKSKNRSTIITAPPRFASETQCPTTLYELIENIYDQSLPLEKRSDIVPDYNRDIYPMFRRIYRLSWTNPSANEAKAHGPEHITYFESKKLSNNSDKYKTFRQALFRKIRPPVSVSEPGAGHHDQQVENNSKLMPFLWGDQINDEHSPYYYATLTQLQYRKFEQWANGNFTNNKPDKPYESFDQIPLEEQPDALTRSALEWSIGTALYPGIEVDWHSELPEMYKLEPRESPEARDKFRYAESLKPGDLTKGLSLPWQSDYFMCRNHWWPSTRPDAVVTEQYFNSIKSTQPPETLFLGLTQRSRWDSDISGPTGMVNNWTKLGFVVPHPYDGDPPDREIYVEKERILQRLTEQVSGPTADPKAKPIGWSN